MMRLIYGCEGRRLCSLDPRELQASMAGEVPHVRMLYGSISQSGASVQHTSFELSRAFRESNSILDTNINTNLTPHHTTPPHHTTSINSPWNWSCFTE
jgi:hypothetical protein